MDSRKPDRELPGILGVEIKSINLPEVYFGVMTRLEISKESASGLMKTVRDFLGASLPDFNICVGPWSTLPNDGGKYPRFLMRFFSEFPFRSDPYFDELCRILPELILTGFISMSRG